MSITMTCSYGSYYDPNTYRCHPCSDCTDPRRPPNQFCTKTCITEKCEGRQYYDTNLKKCFPCSDCEDPRMGTDICMRTCQNIPTSTIAPAMLTTILPSSQSSNPTIIPVVAVCSILLAVVLVIVAFIIYKYFGKRPGHGGKLPFSGTNEQLLQIGGGNTPTANGPNSLTANGHTVASPTSSDTAQDFDLQSITVTNATNTAFLSMPRNSSSALLSHRDVDMPHISTPLLNEHPASAITSDGSHSVTIPAGGGQGQSSTRSTPSTRHVSFSQPIGSSSTDGSGLHSDTEDGLIVTHPCENNGPCHFLPSRVSMPFSLS